MADGVKRGQSGMKEVTVSVHPDSDALSSQGDPEDMAELDPGYVEERFRVDRRKLEAMLHQGPGHDGEVAEEFFQKIMEETKTQITWPSKLKVGAKSKKDPHIKVYGPAESIQGAKDRVLAVLEIKSNRVTLKMDVSHTDHSHVIGKGGNNIKQVMQDTGCHIHFPDSNRSSQLEKSNQVSIAGQPEGVEQARNKIRELLPLVFMVELPVTSILVATLDASSPTIQYIQSTYSVTVTCKQRPRVFSTTTVMVRGSVSNAKAVKEATVRLIEHLTGNRGSSAMVSMQLEIAPQHHLFMMGRNGANLKQIMGHTGASIHFPDPSTSLPQRRGTVYITGTIDSVYMARQQLIGCLPLVLMFDMKDDLQMDQAQISRLMEQLDVFISIKPKPKQPSKSVIVKSVERNAPCMYIARARLLGELATASMPSLLPQDGSRCHSDTLPARLGLGGLNVLSLGMLGVNNGPFLLLNGTQSPIASPRTQEPPPVITPTAGLPSALYPGLVMMSSNATLAPTKCAFTHLPQPPFTAPQESPSPPALAPTVAPTAVTSSGRITSSNSGASRRISTDGGMSSVGHSIDNVGGPSSVQSMNSSSDVPSSPSRHASLPPVRLSVTSDHKPLTDSSRLTHCLTGTHQQKPSHIHNIPAPVKTGISSTGPSAHYGSTHSSPSGGSPLLLPRPPSLPSGPGPSTPPGPPGPTTPPGLQASLCNHGNSPMLPDAAVSLASHLEPAAFLEANIPSFLVDSQPAVVTTASTDYPPPPPPGFRRSDALPTIPPPLTQLQQPPLASHHDMAGLHTLASGKNEGYSTDLLYTKPAFSSYMDTAMTSAGLDTNHYMPQQSHLSADLHTNPSLEMNLNNLHLSMKSSAAHPSTISCPLSGQSQLGLSTLQGDLDLTDSHLTRGPSSPTGPAFPCTMSSLVENSYNSMPPRVSTPSPTMSYGGALPGLQINGSPKKQNALLDSASLRNGTFHSDSRSSESGCDSDCSDHRSTNGSINNNTSKLFPMNNSLFSEFGDYEKKKLLATKAMQKKPEGESRIPTDFWSGLGFSKSMPDQAIRERLKQNNIRFADKNTLCSTQLPEEDELETELWADSSPHPDQQLSSTSTDFNTTRRKLGGGGLDNGSLLTNAMSKADLAELFSSLGLSKYTDLFQQQEIDLGTFVTLTDQDLKELGITTFGARRKMLMAITDLSKRPPPLSAAPGANNPFRTSSASQNFMKSSAHHMVSQSGRW